MAASQTANPSAERILRAATALFARRGFAGTTTRMIAARARMNEALIFRHFPSKRHLYSAILQRKMEEDPVLHDLPPAAMEGALEPLLHTLAGRILATIKSDPKFMRLLYFSGLEGHALAPEFFKSYARRVTGFLSAVFEKAMHRGEMRRIEPVLAARAFTGMIAHHAQVAEFFRFKAGRWSDAELVRGYVDLFLRGVAAPNRKRTRAAK